MNQRQYLEAAARCISIMVFYHNSERSERSEEAMAAEIRDVAEMIANLTQPDEDAYRVHVPVEEGLIARYGPVVGPRLYAAFADAYETAPSFEPLYPAAETLRYGRKPVAPPMRVGSPMPDDGPPSPGQRREGEPEHAGEFKAAGTFGTPVD